MTLRWRRASWCCRCTPSTWTVPDVQYSAVSRHRLRRCRAEREHPRLHARGVPGRPPWRWARRAPGSSGALLGRSPSAVQLYGLYLRRAPARAYLTQPHPLRSSAVAAWSCRRCSARSAAGHGLRTRPGAVAALTSGLPLRDRRPRQGPHDDLRSRAVSGGRPSSRPWATRADGAVTGWGAVWEHPWDPAPPNARRPATSTARAGCPVSPTATTSSSTCCPSWASLGLRRGSC